MTNGHVEDVTDLRDDMVIVNVTVAMPAELAELGAHAIGILIDDLGDHIEVHPELGLLGDYEEDCYLCEVLREALDLLE